MVKLIGIAGTFASGKDTVAEYLAERYGYVHISTGDIVREEAKKRGLTTHRDDLFIVANDLRKNLGADVLVVRSLEEHEKSGGDKLIISGIRNSKEVETLHSRGGLFVFVDAAVDRRFARAKDRGRLEDNTDLAGFMAQEERELKNTDPAAQHIEALRPFADVTIFNDSTLAKLQTQADKLVRL